MRSRDIPAVANASMTDLISKTQAVPESRELPVVGDPLLGETNEPEVAPQSFAPVSAGPGGRTDLICCLVPAAASVALLIWFRPLITSGLWWDEQWRAYHVVLPGLQLDLGTTYAPTAPAWLLIEKFSVGLFGAQEWALRAPSIAAWLLIGPLTYRLCRRLMGRAASLISACALACTPAVLYFGTELKPYATETLATVAIIIVWTRAHEANGIERVAWYAAMALVALVSVPAVFIVAPLIALDVVLAMRAIRLDSRESLRLLAIAGATSAAVIIPLTTQVLPQPAGAQYSYFQFLPTNFWQALNDVVHQVGGLLAGAWTSASMIKTDTSSVPLAAPSHLLFVCAQWGVAALVIFGAWHVRHSLVGLGLTSVLVGGIGLQVVTSLLHKWPIGIARVNLFLLPVVYLLTVAGLVWAWQALRNARSLGRVVLLPVLCAGIALIGLVGVQDVASTGALHGDIPLQRWAESLRTVVSDTRKNAGRGALAVVQMDGGESGFFAEPRGATRGLGWIVYMDDYSYPKWNGPRISLSRTFFCDISQQSTTALGTFIADHPQATIVEQYSALGGFASGAVAGSLVTSLIRSFGFEVYSTVTYKDSGQLTIWHR